MCREPGFHHSGSRFREPAVKRPQAMAAFYRRPRPGALPFRFGVGGGSLKGTACRTELFERS